MRYCPNYSRVAVRAEPGSAAVRLFRVSCNQWSCPYCAARLRSRWRDHLLQQCQRMQNEGAEWWLLTLTAPADKRTQEQSYKALQAGIEKLLKRLRRSHAKTTIEYARVYEKHPTSEALHAHLVISNICPFVVTGAYPNHQLGFIACLNRPFAGTHGIWNIRTYIKKISNDVGMGYQADIKPLPAGSDAGYRAGMYVVKYLTKASQDIRIKNMRHVQTSRGFGALPERHQKGWTILDRLARADFGYVDIIDIDTKTRVGSEYWISHDSYPSKSD